MDEEYKKLVAAEKHRLLNSCWFEIRDGKPILHNNVCFASFQAGWEHLRFNIDRFSIEDNYQKNELERSSEGCKQQLETAFKVMQEVVKESFLSEVFINRDEDYLENGLIVNPKHHHAAIWAAMVQLRMLYEFPVIAKYYNEWRELGFSVDESIIFCQLGFPKGEVFVYSKEVNSHGTVFGWGGHTLSDIKKYCVRKFSYLDSVSGKFCKSGSGWFSKAVFQNQNGLKLENDPSIQTLKDFFHGDKDV